MSNSRAKGLKCGGRQSPAVLQSYAWTDGHGNQYISECPLLDLDALILAFTPQSEFTRVIQ